MAAPYRTASGRIILPTMTTGDSMLRKFLHTTDDVAPFILRITMGGVVLAHGFQKLPGWFGGHGAMATMEAFNQ